ncbi:uncharacterized protein LOC142972412 [Anticarsia gemmatalis]|uniref:uncharacterized protein LOC142972412 n=1 Tax=Anticarsia gemmatalis TaxID=129554 RepID=UPI003F7602A9
MCSVGPHWVKCSNGSMPNGAVPAGVDLDGKEMFVARAHHDNCLVPGKIIPSREKHAYIPYDGKEHHKTEYEVLVNSPNHWVPASGSNIPPNALPGGTDKGETYYIGRARVQGALTCGKVHPSHAVCYVSFDGKEHHFSNYEILINKPQDPHWVKCSNGSMPSGAVPAGVDLDGKEMFVARAHHDNCLVPGKIIPSRDRHAYVPYDGKEHHKTEYEVLVNSPNHWVPASGSNIPPNALPGGTDKGETYYIGRARVQGALTCGKVHPSHAVCYVSFDGKEHHFADYEILINKPQDPHWVKCSNGSMPSGAVPAGVDLDGKEMFVARAHHDNCLVPGKIIPSRDRHAYVPYDGKEHHKTEYEVLVNSPNHWVPASGSNIPPNALPGGTDKGETYYIGRARVQGALTCGKVHPSHAVCYVSFDGKEHHFSDYEILVDYFTDENEGIVHPGESSVA